MMFIHLVGKFGGKVWLRHIWFHCRTVVQVAVFGGKVVWESCVGKLCGKVVWESCVGKLSKPHTDSKYIFPMILSANLKHLPSAD